MFQNLAFRALLTIFTAMLALTMSVPGWARSAAQGGADGGGGNTLQSKPLTKLEVQIATEVLPAYVEKVLFFQNYIFEMESQFIYKTERDEGFHDQATFAQGMFGNHIPNVDVDELKKVDYKLLYQTHQKMFMPQGGRESILKMVRHLRFRLQASGPCFDLEHRARDGASFQAGDQNVICLSTDRLLTKLTRSNFVSQFLALAVHELSHRAGASETEAVNLQRVVAATVRQPTWDALYLLVRNDGDYPRTFQLSELQESLSQSPFDPVEFCGTLLDSVGSVNWARSTLFKTGALERPLKFYKAFEAASAQFEELTGFCRKKSRWGDKVLNSEIQKIHNDGMNNEGLYVDGVPRTFKYGIYMDREAAVYNFEQIKKNVELLQQSQSYFYILNFYSDVRFTSDLFNREITD